MGEAVFNPISPDQVGRLPKLPSKLSEKEEIVEFREKHLKEQNNRVLMVLEQNFCILKITQPRAKGRGDAEE